jgi:hypothetical protein
VPGGLSFEDCAPARAELSKRRIVGVEIAEFESEWLDGRPAARNAGGCAHAAFELTGTLPGDEISNPRVAGVAYGLSEVGLGLLKALARRQRGRRRFARCACCGSPSCWP